MIYKGEVDFNFSLAGKVAAVTGAASGIGQAIAMGFAKKGADIVLIDMNPDVSKVEQKIIESGSKAVSVVADITNSSLLESIRFQSEKAFPKIDILVNCAGILIMEEAENTTEEAWDKTMNVNLKAAFRLSQTFGRHMIKNGGGKIINIASQASDNAFEKHAAYCASKAALVSITRVLAIEWGKYNINVNAISPTVVLTELGKKAWDNTAGEELKKEIPAGRFAYPEEIAACAVYLASGASDMITGANIIIDGGFTVK